MFLDQILVSVHERVECIRAQSGWLYDRAREQPSALSLAHALQIHQGMATGVIAECKQRSPSKGWLTDSYDPAQQAQQYEQRGAHGISVLTEPDFFSGSLEHLQLVKAAVGLPVLRKDFLVDPVQVFESRAFGADAVLVIVRIVDDLQLRDLLQAAGAVGIQALVEVHAPGELERALSLSPQLVGINNRDLDSFDTTLDFSEKMAPLIPSSIVKISESGIQTAADVERLQKAGYSAILVGEHLMRGGQLLEALKIGR
jgi:indole-3-glycerol phosphate synthase